MRKTALMGWSVMLASAWEEHVLQHVVKTVIVGTVAESVRAMLVSQGSARSYPVHQAVTLTKTANLRCVAHM